MSSLSKREEVLQILRASISRGDVIVGAGAGIGLSAKFLQAGGADLVILYNSGRYRMAGRGSLAGLMPYGNANDIVIEMAHEILPLLTPSSTSTSTNTTTSPAQQPSSPSSIPTTIPVLAGVCASDPFRSIPRFIAELSDLGFAGIQNFPTVGLIDGVFRQQLEETGMGYACEVALIAEARRQGLLTTPYVFNADEAARMVEAGADVLVAHMGLTTSGSIGAKTGKTLEECVRLIQEIRDVAAERNPEIIVLCHGGPIAAPEDARFVLERTKGVHGFYGASSMERLPVEEAITNITKEFKRLTPGS
ncbi:MAG: hypothetical protein M1821_000773 [Bathelium mastoideum]|nr:MAG: hypothetical protein M1821_000773 [Bathelium mastoideum]